MKESQISLIHGSKYCRYGWAVDMKVGSKHWTTNFFTCNNKDMNLSDLDFCCEMRPCMEIYGVSLIQSKY